MTTQAGGIAHNGTGDTHLCQIESGVACSVCGLKLAPKLLGANSDRLSLPGWPPDPDQVCPQCQKGARRRP